MDRVGVRVTNANTVLAKFSEGSNPTAVNVIYANPDGNFTLYESVINGYYGTYYNVSTWDANNMSKMTQISIWYPELSIQAKLTTGGYGVTSGDSINGKTINKDTNVTFLLNTPMVGPANDTAKFPTGRFVTINTNLSAKIVFTTPAGGKTTVFGVNSDTNSVYANYNDIPVTQSQNVVGSAIPGVNAVAGTWTAQAEFIGYKPFADNAKTSGSISYTVQSTTLTITAAKDSVVRSNPFTVALQGESNKIYFVYIENIDADSGY
ncbi:MAG TPA: hypothetical protein O0X38_02810, partial [Methanocorpusculum sp.]|nr:hypothetical protein [Methanocorpusculum sp.]